MLYLYTYKIYFMGFKLLENGDINTKSVSNRKDLKEDINKVT